ncbi:MAG: glutamyl-tRNA reductase [Nitrososphaerota archaeon]
MAVEESRLDILLIGSNFRTCSLDVLERLAIDLTLDRVIQALYTVCDSYGLSILFTCNRFEIYLVTDKLDAPRRRIVALFAGVGVSECQFYMMEGREAIKHLIEVACGLDSLAPGETQILQQVRDAKFHGVGKYSQVVKELFVRSYNAARRIRRAVGIDDSINIGTLAIQLLKARLGASRPVLVVGAGKIGKAVIEGLAQAGFEEVYVATRNPSSVPQHAKRLVRSVTGLDSIHEILGMVDGVIVATSSKNYVIDDRVLNGFADGKRLVMIDLSVPRNIDPTLSTNDFVELYDIEDLKALAPAPRFSNGNVDVDEMLEKEADRLFAWLRAISADDIIRSVRVRAEMLRQRELSKALRLLTGSQERDASVLEALSKSIVNKLLHEPTVRLRRLAASEKGELYVKLARDLFGLAEPSN